MKEEGKVIKISKGIATIEITPRKECTKCCSCNAARFRHITISGEKAKALSMGDHVEIEISTASMMKIYILLYGVPLLAFVVGVFSLYAFFKSPIISFIGAFISTLLAYLMVGFYIRRNFNFSPDICVKNR